MPELVNRPDGSQFSGYGQGPMLPMDYLRQIQQMGQQNPQLAQMLGSLMGGGSGPRFNIDHFNPGLGAPRGADDFGIQKWGFNPSAARAAYGGQPGVQPNTPPPQPMPSDPYQTGNPYLDNRFVAGAGGGWADEGGTIQLPDGRTITMPQGGLSQAEYDVLSGIRAGNPLADGNQSFVDSLMQRGILGGGTPVVGDQGGTVITSDPYRTPPGVSGGQPRPMPSNPVQAPQQPPRRITAPPTQAPQQPPQMGVPRQPSQPFNVADSMRATAGQARQPIPPGQPRHQNRQNMPSRSGMGYSSGSRFSI